MASWQASKARASKEARKRVREFWQFREELTAGRTSERFRYTEDLKEDLEFENQQHRNLEKDLRQFEEMPAEDVEEQVEPFSLQFERESGEIDSSGNLLAAPKAQEKDSWADSLDALPIKHFKPSDSPAAAPPPPAVSQLKAQLHSLMLDSETVAHTLNRLRGSRPNKPNFKRNHRKTEGETKEKGAESSAIAGEEFRKAVEMVSALIGSGEVDINEWKKCDFELFWKVRTGETLAGPYTSSQIRQMKAQGVQGDILQVNRQGKATAEADWQPLNTFNTDDII